MHEYYFANYRLLVDDAISSDDSMEYLAGFSKVMPATHTFTVHMGEEALLDQKPPHVPSSVRQTVLISTTRRILGLSSHRWMRKR